METPVFGGFNAASEARVASIDAASLIAAADAVILSCTNLRTLDVTEEVAQTLGTPVLSYYQVLIWHMLRLPGTEASLAGLGR